MKKYVAEKLMELAALERDIQDLYIKVKNPGNVMYACSNPTLEKIKEHVELLEIQLFELKGDLAERDCRIHSMQVELDDSKNNMVPNKKTGVYLISEERKRQIEALGYTPKHDQRYCGQLSIAASCYALPQTSRNIHDGRHAPVDWPFSSKSWKPSPDNRIRELQKAGALIAAEIDRLKYSEKDSLLYTKENNHE